METLLAIAALIVIPAAIGGLIWALAAPRARIVSREDERINARMRAEREARDALRRIDRK